MVKVKEDLTGRVFNRLTVIRQVDDYVQHSGRHIPMWLCKCSCEENKEVIVRGADLKSGMTQSCGCLNRERVRKYNYYEMRKDGNGEYYVGWTTNTNNEFYFDIQDYDIVKQYCWFENNNKGYISLMAWNIGVGGVITMAQLLLGRYYDHIDRNTLNNRRNNLRKSTVAQNSANRSLMKNNSSGVMGVHFDSNSLQWIACIQVEHKYITLGRFSNKNDAIKARLLGEQKYFKEFAPQQHLYEQYGISLQNNNEENENDRSTE